LGFLLFSVPIITGSLGLASTISIDARVKTGIIEEHYCGLAVNEYFSYLVSNTVRWEDWLTEYADPGNPGTYAQTVGACGENITVTAVQEINAPEVSLTDPLVDPAYVIPPISLWDFPKYSFQTSKTVSDSNPTGGDSVVYTITVINRVATATELPEIVDILPTGFSYDCAALPDQLTLPGMAPQDFAPVGAPCPGGTTITWTMPPGTFIATGEVVTLTFTAVTSVVPGTYCNEARVHDGGNSNNLSTSGKTAIVQIGPSPGLCPQGALLTSKILDSAVLVFTDTSTDPYTYTFNIDYKIKVDNIGSFNVELHRFKDILPVGFTYVSTSPFGDIQDEPKEIKWQADVGRWSLKWEWKDRIDIPPGTSLTLIFSTIAVITLGNFVNDLLVDPHGTDMTSRDIYTWPTGSVSIKDLYNVTATDANGDPLDIALRVLVGADGGEIDIWDIR